MEKFHLKSYSRLKKELGKIDGIIEVIELSLRHFEATKGFFSFEEKVKKYSIDYGVKVDSGNAEEIFHITSQIYILSSYGSFDKFLDSFKDEVDKYKRVDWKKLKDGSKLDKILEAISYNKFKQNVLYKGYEYYRLGRNQLAHSGSSKKKSLDSDVIDEIFKCISKDAKNVKSYVAFNSGKYSFDDFIVFSNIIKKIAKDLCCFIKPNDISEFKDLLQYDQKKKELDPKRFNNYLKFELSSFGVEEVEAYINKMRE